MAESKKEIFEKKYGLVGKGRKVRISPRVKLLSELYEKRSKRIVEAGKDWAKSYKGTFGAV